MKYQFDQLAVRETFANMKLIETPSQVIAQDGITFSGAEMDFPTAPEIIAALTKRAQNGLYGYTLADEQYLYSIQSWMKRRRHWNIEKQWIVPTNGTLHGIGTFIKAFTNPGDGVIIQPPVYMLYERVIASNKRSIVKNPLLYENNSYHMNFEQLEQLMAEESNKVMILCNPHNPISKVWDKEQLATLVELANRYNVMLISDEIFAEIVFKEQHVTPLLEIEAAKERSVVFTSIGKSFNFTGFSHANVIIASDQLREKFLEQRRADHYGSMNPFIREAVIAAYNEGEAWFDAMLQYVQENIRIFHEFFDMHYPEVSISPMEGTYLAWVNWNAFGLNNAELEAFLLEEAALDVDQGWHFGENGSGYTRINLATPREQLVKALERLHLAKPSLMNRIYKQGVN